MKRLSPEDKRRLHFVAHQAYLTASTLSPTERADLLEGIALILPAAEASLAELAAFSIRKSELHQLQFAELFTHSGE